MTLDLLQADAIEMAGLLKSPCVQRHKIISHGKLSELLTAICTQGFMAECNAPGHDVRAPNYGLIEVKSRELGTDGPFPRVSLNDGKLRSANWFMAVRWTPEGALYAAIMLPLSSVQPLYDAHKQNKKPTAHIPWSDWLRAPGGKCFTSEFRAKLKTA